MHFDHKFWMKEAINIAREIKNEVPVCALIVKDGKLISKTINKTETLKDPTAHAEILSVKEASEKLNNWRLNDCILYTTLEPCSMCAGAILNSRIKTLVFGAYDPIAGACGSVISLFSEFNKQKQIEVIDGILELEASKLIKDFFAVRR